MKKHGSVNLGLTGYDELFMTHEERVENRLPKIYDLPLSEIDPFPDHPFKVRMDEDMELLVQSVKERGVITRSPCVKKTMAAMRSSPATAGNGPASWQVWKPCGRKSKN